MQGQGKDPKCSGSWAGCDPVCIAVSKHTTTSTSTSEREQHTAQILTEESVPRLSFFYIPRVFFSNTGSVEYFVRPSSGRFYASRQFTLV